MPRFPVLGDSDNVVYHAHEAHALWLVDSKRAEWTLDRRSLRLSVEPGEPGHGVTRTARGGILGLIGRGQQYTEQNRGRVTGFKTITLKDRPLFNMATIGACKAAS